MRIISIAWLATCFAACTVEEGKKNTRPSLPTSTTNITASAGGSAISMDTRFAVQIGPGALAENAAVQIREGATSPAAAVSYGKVYEVTVTPATAIGGGFSASVEFDLQPLRPIDPNDLLIGTGANVGEGIDNALGGTHDALADIFSATVSGFSFFVLLDQTDFFSCSCDTSQNCDSGCSFCDGDCMTGCTCDTSTSCESGCTCDEDCGGGCQCDVTFNCDANCSCDFDCSSCTCDVTGGCDSGCSCDFDCGAEGSSSTCFDGVDNDADGAIDCSDAGCGDFCGGCSCNVSGACDSSCSCDPDCTPVESCTGATIISGASGSISGSTSGTSSFGSGCGSSPELAPEALFQWTAPSSGTFTFATCGGVSWDSVLSARNASCAETVCNDDGVNCSSTESELNVTVTSGQQIFIVVDGYNSGSMGSFTMTWGAAPPP